MGKKGGVEGGKEEEKVIKKCKGERDRDRMESKIKTKREGGFRE